MTTNKILPMLIGLTLANTAFVVHAATKPVAPAPLPALEVIRVCPHPVNDHISFGPRASSLEAKIEEHDERWDHCIFSKGIPVPGYPAGERWGMVCLNPEAVILIDGVAW